VAGAVRPPRALPPVLFYDELAALPGDAWLGFQAALLARDRRAAPQRSGCPKPDYTHKALPYPCLPGCPGSTQAPLSHWRAARRGFPRHGHHCTGNRSAVACDTHQRRSVQPRR